MVNFIKRAIVIASIAILFCIAVGGIVTISTSNEYEDNYQKGFVYQYRRLQSAPSDEKKIVVFGGSYLAFSLDTKYMQELTGVPTYELGVQSNMGMCYSIELLKDYINAGDIVVFPFEDFEKDDYGMDLIYITIESEPDMMIGFLKDHPKEMLEAWPRGIYRRVAGLFRKTGDPYYTAEGFDRDFAYYNLDRPAPVKSREELSKDGPEGYAYTMQDVDSSCIDELNELNAFCEEKGATLLITYSPMCKQSVFTDEAGREKYMNELEEAIDAPIICKLDECFYDADLIFNGNKHLNNIGMKAYTEDLSGMVKKYIK